MFKRRKLATKKNYKYQYGKSPLLQKTLKNRTGKLSMQSPKNFHTPKRKSRLNSMSFKIPSKFKALAILLGIISAIGLTIYSLTFSTYFEIKEIQVSTEQQNTQNLSTNIVNELRIYKGKNIFWIDKVEIIEKIQSSYPEIENINVGRDFPSTIEISFTEYPLLANITNVSNESNKKFIINSIGYVVKEDVDDPNLPYIKINTDAPLNTTTALLEKEELTYILEATNYFEEKFGMKIIEIEYKVTPREIHLRTEKYFYIWLDIQKSYEQQLKKLKKALVKLDIYNDSLYYIDLRITGESGEKIIYKRR
jgi:cell division septal protein FtsQ